MLASGADGIKEAIQGFDDAYVNYSPAVIGEQENWLTRTDERAILRMKGCLLILSM